MCVTGCFYNHALIVYKCAIHMMKLNILRIVWLLSVCAFHFMKFINVLFSYFVALLFRDRDRE